MHCSPCLRRALMRSLRVSPVAMRRSRPSTLAKPLPIKRHTWTIASDVAEIGAVVDAVTQLCVAAGFSSRLCRLNVPVALTEALSNAIICGNRSDRTRAVRVCAAVEAELLVLEVTDEGEGFDADAIQHSPDDADWLEREDGRGIFLMRALMDQVESRRESSTRGHTVQLTLRRA